MSTEHLPSDATMPIPGPETGLGAPQPPNPASLDPHTSERASQDEAEYTSISEVIETLATIATEYGDLPVLVAGYNIDDVENPAQPKVILAGPTIDWPGDWAGYSPVVILR